MPTHAAALRFIDCFPEAAAWNVTLLTEEKRAIVAKPQCSRDALLKDLKGWLSMKAVHFFVRPLLNNVVMIDLDEFKGDMDVLVALQPRALVNTSPGNYQLWLTIPESLAGKTAPWITSELTEALGYCIAHGSL